MNKLKEFLIRQYDAFMAWKAKKDEIRNLKAQIKHEAEIEAIKQSKDVLVQKHLEEIKNPKEKKGLGQSLGLNLDANKMLNNMGVGNQKQMESILGVENTKPKKRYKKIKRSRKRAKSKSQQYEEYEDDDNQRGNGFGGMGVDFNAGLNKMLGK